MEILAGACGCLAGVVGFAPFLLFGGRLRKRFAEAGPSSLKFALLVPVLSFILMIAAIALCWWLAPAFLLIFAVACIVVFLAVTAVYTVQLVKR